MSAWEGKSMKQKCECEKCQTGETSHNDNSHDQSLYQKITINSKTLTIHGGTTKCARVMTQYFANLPKEFFQDKKLIELGSGTGCVGMALTVLGAQVTFTDQEPMLEQLQENLSANEVTGTVEPLLWGDTIDTKRIIPPFDYVIGSDLIFADECNPPLVETYKALATLSTPNCTCFLASIERFAWEKKFFDMMDEFFVKKLVHEEGDIHIWQFNLKA